MAVWRTQLGERVLRGGEWELFREGVSVLWDLIEDSPEDDPYPTGVNTFDRLQRNQKLVLLATVSRALRDEEVPSPKLTALTEATVAAVFRHILGLTLSEIEMDDAPDAPGFEAELAEESTSWRHLVLAACRDAMKPQTKKSRQTGTVDEEGSFESRWAGPLPDETSEDEVSWTFVVDWLADLILWDSDYEMEDDFMDADPVESAPKRAVLGIGEGYFSDVAPDPSDSQMETIRQTLRDVCDRG